MNEIDLIDYKRLESSILLYRDGLNNRPEDADEDWSPFNYDQKAHRVVRDTYTSTEFEHMATWLEGRMHSLTYDERLQRAIAVRLNKWESWLNGRTVQAAFREQSKERYARTFGIYSIFIEQVYEELTNG